YNGWRALVSRTDAAVLRALRLDKQRPRPVSALLLTAIPEAPAITAPPIPDAGAAGAVPGFRVGSVVRVARAGGDDHYVVLADGIQPIGQVTADLVRFTNTQGGNEIVTVAPDALRAVPSVQHLAVSTFPDHAGSPAPKPATL